MNFKMSIKNYKSFKNKQEITFAPITIFVGPNSGGKSSIIKLLGFLWQNILSDSIYERKGRVVYNGSKVNLKGFSSMTHNQNKQPIDIQIEVPRAGIEDEVVAGPTGFELFNEKTKLAYHITKDKVIPSFKFSNTDTFDLSEPNFLGKYYSQTESNELVKGKYKISNRTKNKIKKEIISLKTEFLDCLTLITDGDKKISESRWKEFNKSLQEFHFLQCEGFKFVPSGYNFDSIATPIFAYYEQNPQFFKNFESIDNIGINGKSYKYTHFTNRFTEADCFDNTNFEEYYSQLFKYLPANTRTRLTRKESTKKIFMEELDIFNNIKNVIKYHLESGIKEKQLVVLENVLWHSILEIYIDHYIAEYHKIRDNYETYTKPTLHAFTGSMVFLPPVRQEPQEIYSERELINVLTGEKLPVLDGELPPKSWKKSDIEKLLNDIDMVNKYLGHLGMSQILDINKTERGNHAIRYYLELVNPNNNLCSELNEVGYGYSQLLPILFSLKNYYTGNRVIIEQPELHIHPAIQSRLADIIFNAVNVRSNSSMTTMIDGETYPVNYNDQNSVVIETHSEYIIRKLLVYVAQGKLKPSDIAVNYVEKDKSGNSTVKRMEIDDQGFFKEEWPEGFFDNTMKLSEEIWTARKIKNN